MVGDTCRSAWREIEKQFGRRLIVSFFTWLLKHVIYYVVLACLAPKEQRIMTHRRGLSMQFQLDLLRESLGEFGLHGSEVIMMVPRQ